MSFGRFDATLEEDIGEYARAIKTTLPIERAFNNLRKAERRSMVGKVVPTVAWSSFCHGGLPADFDRAPAPITNAAVSVAPTDLAQELFEPKGECSVDAELLNTITLPRATWPALGDPALPAAFGIPSTLNPKPKTQALNPNA